MHRYIVQLSCKSCRQEDKKEEGERKASSDSIIRLIRKVQNQSKCEDSVKKKRT